MNDRLLSPAEHAAEQALDRMYACIDAGKSFRLEAGAGAGKTYSLIKALKYVLEKQASQLVRRHQQIACITYTNVARDEIETRTDRHPALLSSTIHAFCWSLIKDYQPFLRQELPTLDRWQERLDESGGLGSQPVDYSLGYPEITENHVSLHHNDVLKLTVRIMKEAKFRTLMAARYPILFIDEYQDTDKDIAQALKESFLDDNKGPLLGFFGDEWQKIYGTGCGRMEHQSLVVIDKEANFRSAPVIVDVLNKMRPQLPQRVQYPSADGSVAVFHTNDWVGQRQAGQHWDGDLPAEAAADHLAVLIATLTSGGWDFSPDTTKILMLTHRLLARNQGYATLDDIFPNNDLLIKKEDDHIAFLVDTVEPVCAAYGEKRFGDMFVLLGGRTPVIQSHADKVAWATDMDRLLELRATSTVGAVLDHLKETTRPRLTDAVERKEREFEEMGQASDAEEPSWVTRLRQLREVSYQEIIAFAQFSYEKTPFSTKHGVKGAEFENVLVVFGRGWSQYNFGQFLEWSHGKVPAGREDTFERNRNLFYVVCSRSKKRLALLFTQELSPAAIATLSTWFGHQSIHSLRIHG